MRSERDVAPSDLHGQHGGAPRRSEVSRPVGWIIDGTIGGLVGGVVGAIAAVNIVIFGGITGGYEADFALIFDESPLVGTLALGVLVAGPIGGALIARRLRRADRR